ncbi:immunoglobulin domain-containing protein, partial [Algoriphagus litoralis]
SKGYEVGTAPESPEAPISLGNKTVCALDVIQTLTAEATVGKDETLFWYSSQEALTPIQGLPTLSQIGTITYWAEAVSAQGCASQRTPVTLTINNCSIDLQKVGTY